MEENINSNPFAIPWMQDVENQAWFQYDYNLNNGDIFSQTANPGRVQFSEWAQQMVATMYQNWFNSEPEKMKRSLVAGINPFVAASGIAGSGNTSVAPPSTPSNPQLPQMLNAGASLLGAAGTGFGAFANGFTQLSKLNHELNKIDAETQQIFVELGFSKLQSRALSIQLRYMNVREKIGVWQALANLDKTRQDYKNMLAEHNNILARYDEILANKDMLIATKGELEARKMLDDASKAKIEEETRFIKTDNDFWDAHGYLRHQPVYESIRNMVVNGVDFDAEKYGDAISSVEGKVAGAVEDSKQSAIANHAYAIEYARSNGKNASDELFGRIGSPADFAGRVAKMGTDFINNLGANVNDLFKSGDAKSIRKDLNLILQNAYDQLDKFPEDEKRLIPIIHECQAALSLRNSELVDWWKTKNK